MNKVEVIRQSTPLEREVWLFLLTIGHASYDCTILLIRYEKQAKQTNRHHWKTTKYFDSYNQRGISVNAVPFPADVEAEARKKFQDMMLTLPVRR